METAGSSKHNQRTPKVCPNSPESPHLTSGESRTERTQHITDQRHPLNGHLGVGASLKLWRSFIRCTEPIGVMGRDSSPWTPVCTSTSVLTNTSPLAQRTPGQPGRHSTGCGHRLVGQERTCSSGDTQTNQK